MPAVLAQSMEVFGTFQVCVRWVSTTLPAASGLTSGRRVISIAVLHEGTSTAFRLVKIQVVVLYMSRLQVQNNNHRIEFTLVPPSDSRTVMYNGASYLRPDVRTCTCDVGNKTRESIQNNAGIM